MRHIPLKPEHRALLFAPPTQPRLMQALARDALVVAIGLVLIAALVCGIRSARADDHMIRPVCWEENVGGVPQRHCEVNRPPQPAGQPPAHAPQPPARAVPPPQAADQGPPLQAYAGPYPGYQSTVPPRYWPGMPQPGRNIANPCTPYACGYGSPYGYGYPPPYPPPYYGDGYVPGIVFGLGPFTIVIP